MAFRSESIVFIAFGGANSVWVFGHGLAADGCDERKTDSMISIHAFPAGDIESETMGGMEAGFSGTMSLTTENCTVKGTIGHVFVNTGVADGPLQSWVNTWFLAERLMPPAKQ